MRKIRVLDFYTKINERESAYHTGCMHAFIFITIIISIAKYLNIEFNIWIFFIAYLIVDQIIYRSWIRK